MITQIKDFHEGTKVSRKHSAPMDIGARLRPPERMGEEIIKIFYRDLRERFKKLSHGFPPAARQYSWRAQRRDLRVRTKL